MKKRSEVVSSRNQIQSKLQKNHDYSKGYIDGFNLIVVNPLPKLTNQEFSIIVASFLPIYQDQSIENNTNMILTHLLKR